MEKRRVVITGMGTVNPIGNSVAESWQAAKDGKCGIGPITRYDCSNMRVKLAGEVKDLDIDGILGKREAKKMDRFTQFALIAAQQAMDDSGLGREREVLFARRGETRVVALPFDPEKPFPWPELFCLARIVPWRGREWAVFAFDGRERPILPGKWERK